MAKEASKDKCVVCQKTVFHMEKVSVEGAVFHEGCFKCTHCKKKLTPGTYTALEGTYYCKPHYTQLFTSKGNYSEGFGKEKPTAHWAPSTATFSDPVKNDDKKHDDKHTAPATAAKPPGPPGPPPPPPKDLGLDAPSAAAPASNAHADALAAIASGGLKLKHVSKEDRKRKPVSSVVPAESKPKPAASAATSAKDGFSIRTGTPEQKLDGIKWTLKFFTNRQEDPIKVNITDMKQSVIITDCKNCVIIILGKVTNISIMNSASCGIIFDDIIATAEVTRCQKIQVQANGKIAQIVIDKTQGCDVFVQSPAGKDIELVTSLTSGININFPGATEEDDMVEYPVPDQYLSSLDKTGKLITAPSSHV